MTADQLIQTIEHLAKEAAEPTLLGVPVVFYLRPNHYVGSAKEQELFFDGITIEGGVVYIWIKVQR
jgi:hypothetical protein